jgi:thioredoxin-like negative regulator of GroEL
MKPWHLAAIGGLVAIILVGVWWRYRQQQQKKGGLAVAETTAAPPPPPQVNNGEASPVYDLTEEDVPNILKRDGTVVVLVFAPWCGWCKKMMPEFYKAADSARNVTWARLDSEACPEAAGTLGVKSFPTTLIFRDGSLLHTVPGATSAETLIEQVGGDAQ